MKLVNTLLLIDGAAGTGKSDAIEYLEKRYRQPSELRIIKKVTTREERLEEKTKKIHLDLNFITNKEFNEIASDPLFFQYEYGEGRYGFHRNQIVEALQKNRVTVIIVRSINVIRKLKEDFGWARVVAVYVHTDQSTVRQRLQKDGYGKRYINLRMKRGLIAWQDYLKHPDLYCKVLLNNSSKVDFERLIENLVEHIDDEKNDELIVTGNNVFPLPAPLVGRKKAIIQRLKRTSYSKNVFLMMKFRQQNNSTWEFIRETLEGRGYNCVRADQSEWNITNDVYNPIAVLLCCKYGIALFDEAEEGISYNPNVAYELGIMHYQKKSCLILRHNKLPQPPFDLIKDLHKTYSRDIELRNEICRWLDEIAHID